MRKWLIILIIATVGLLAACGGDTDTSGEKVDETKELKIGATAGPYSDMLKKESNRSWLRGKGLYS